MFLPADCTVATEDWDWEVRAFLHIHEKKRNCAVQYSIFLYSHGEGEQ